MPAFALSSRRRTTGCLAALALLVAGCDGGDDGTLDVALIGSQESVFTSSLWLSGSAQHLRAATESGLVSLNEQGEVVPALAETWLVTDDGLSFIFRLRDGTWPDGEAISADSARDALAGAIAELADTSLGQDLAPIEEIRALAGRVVEIRLTAPEPYLLQLLAQPELALRRDGGGTGPMRLTRPDANSPAATLDFKPPEERGLPADEEWREGVRDVALQVADAPDAIDLFDAGEVDLVLGGTLGDFTLVETGPLSTGTLRVDAALGLFGLRIMNAEGMLGEVELREALAMAIDREELFAAFGLGGWVATTRPVAPGLPDDPGAVAERWQGFDIAELREEAARRVSEWRADAGEAEAPTLSIDLPDGPGWDALFRQLAAQWRTVGIVLERAGAASDADLVLVDRIARYPSPRWFLGQFRCTLGRGLCSEDADTLVTQATTQSDTQLRANLMSQAEGVLVQANVYIPLGLPLRWSLARGNVDGFEANAYGFHPLPPLARIPR